MSRPKKLGVRDVVRVDADPKPWRIDAHDPKTGTFTLEALHSTTRVVWDGVHESRCTRSAVFG
ncbi:MULTISPECIES: hypothetical protein [unclassified Leucobacter]|uniref:hypothetical protein n=1 Tax=unclassified Leucobacter TaxID=2621730 RepID=UPI000621E448|nr:hypothetical protein [Leucobacter sp. Ag1]KKI16396.1 hypothetical protein XM48_16540 [Leucobacter sp. Ag1]